MIPTSAAPTDIGNDGRGVTAPGCRVRQSKLHDSFQALSGIRLPTRSAIGADPMTGKAMPVKSFTQTINPLPEESTTGPLKPKNYSTEIRCSDADSIEPRICKRGHLVAGDNLYTTPRGRIDCKMCRRIILRRVRQKRTRTSILPAALRTHCPKGHPYSPENTVIRKRGWRICLTCEKQQAGVSRARYNERRLAAGLPINPDWKAPFRETRGNLLPHQVREIAERLRSGESLNQITRLGSNRVCAPYTLRAFAHKHQKLWAPLAKLAVLNRDRRRGDASRSRRAIASPLIMSGHGCDAFETISAATRDLPDFLRDDVRSVMFLAAAEGRLKPRDAVKRVREFVTAQNRQFSKFVPGGGGIMRSLDEHVYDDGPTRLVDTVTHGLWQ